MSQQNSRASGFSAASDNNITSFSSNITASTAPFTPTSIAGLRVWLDASDATTINAGSPVDGDGIATWTDKSSNAYSFAQASAPSRPLFKTNIQNSKSIARGSASVISAATGADLTNFTVFVVVSVTTFRQFDAILSSNNQPTGQATIELGATSQFDVWDNNVGAVMATGLGTAPTATFQILCVTYTQTTPAGVFYIANVSKNTTSQSGMLLSCGNMTLFDDATSSFTAFRGDIGEVIVYDSVLSSTDRTNAYNYLKTKWGL